MNIRKFILAQLIALAFLSTSAMAQNAGTRQQAPVTSYAPGKIIVRFRDNIRPKVQQTSNRVSFGIAAFDAVAQRINSVAARRINMTKRNSNSNYTYVISYGAHVDPNEVVKAIMATGVVKYAEPDYLASTETTTPNDAYFNIQWGLHNTGSFAYSSPVVAGADISMREAWDITQGSSSVIVAVIDAGAKMDHPEFSGRIWNNAGEIAGNGVDDDGNGYVDDYRGWDFVSDDNNPTDDHSHGTNVAGIIGANGNNSIGVAGVDWNCKLMILKTQNSAGTGSYSDMVSAINYATDKGAKVINMSLAGSSASSALQDAIDDAYSSGVNVVAAMGNYNTSIPFYPGACNHVIAVGATTAADRRASYSNYGSHITVVAPGSVIFGLWYLSNTDYSHQMSGTSMATPHVAGIVSLLLAQSITRTPDEIKTILQNTSDDMVGLSTEDVAGWDQYYGYGRVNAYRALTNCITPSAGAISGAAQVCASATTTLTNTATGGTWSSSNTSVATIGSSGIVTGIAQGTALISYTKTNSCGTSMVTREIRVNIPPATISGPSTLCASYTASLSNTSGGGTWSSSDAAVAAVGTTTGVVTGVATGTAVISYTTGCGTDVGKLITVHATPSAITGTAAVCIGTSATLANTTPDGTWTSSNVSIATIGSATGIISGIALGTANISYTLSSGCRATIQATVVSPSAITIATVPTSGLLGWYPFSGNANNWLGTGLNGTVNGATLTTDRFGASNSAYYFDGNTANITIDTTFFNVGWSGYSVACWFNSEVLDNPYNFNEAQTIINTIPHNGMAVYFSWLGSHKYEMFAGKNPPTFGWDIMGHYHSQAPATTHVWKHIAMVKSSGNQYVMYVDGVRDTSFTASLMANNYYCKMVLGRSDPGIISEGFYGKLDDYGIWNRSLSDSEVYRLYAGSPLTAVVCEGGTLQLTNATAGGTWSSSNTAVATVGSANGLVAGIAAGTSVISYALGGCSVSVVVTVNASGVDAITGTATLCAGANTTLSNTTPGGTWSSSNTTVATVGVGTGVVNGVSAGTATITYNVTGGCGEAYKVVTVSASPISGSITGASSLCAGTTATFSIAASGGAWSSSNTAAATVGSADGIVTAVSAGTTTISYTVTGDCGVVAATKVVTVNAAAGTISGSLAICPGTTSSLTTGTTGTWSSSNTSVATIGSASGVLSGITNGTATITFTTGSGCRAMAVATISLPGVLSGTFSACVGYTSTISSTTTGGVWSSSNSAIASVDAATGVVTGVAAGSAYISYTVGAGCYRSGNFIVKTPPPAIAAPVTVCAGGTTYVPAPSSTGLSWASSNTAVATIGSSTGILTGVAAGTTTLTYTTSNGCYTTTVATVTAAPSAITGSTALCTGSSETLSNAAAGGTWSSSHTSRATIGSATGIVTPVSAGTATITYSTGGCRATVLITVSAIAAITGPVSMCLGSSVNLAHTTSGGTWSSSNTAVATVGTSGTVTGVAAGTANISYTIPSGCSRYVTVTVAATSASITGTLTACPGTTTTLSSSTAGGTWSGGNAAVATINGSTGIVTGIGAGTITATYAMGAGCRATAIVTVNPLPAVMTGTFNVCVGFASTLASASAGGTWSTANSAIATADPSGAITGVAAGTVAVRYTLSTGCYRAATFTVKALPPAPAATAACEGTTTYVAPPSTNGRSWTSSNIAVATIGSSTGIMTGVTAGTTVLTYTTTTGCYSTTVATVYTLPSAGTITGPATVIAGNTITLDNATIGGVWSSSNTSRATVGAATGIVTGVAAGSATISYSVSNPGCTVRATQVIYVTTSRYNSPATTAVTTLQLYPNPTTGTFTLVSQEAGALSVYSLDGKQVTRYSIAAGANQLTLPADLAAGIYMCRYISESGASAMVRLVYER